MGGKKMKSGSWGVVEGLCVGPGLLTRDAHPVTLNITDDQQLRCIRFKALLSSFLPGGKITVQAALCTRQKKWARLTNSNMLHSSPCVSGFEFGECFVLICKG